METYYKSEANHYRQSYIDAQDRISQMNFQLGWLRGSLKRLGKLVESGDVTANEFAVAELESIINAFAKSREEAELYFPKTETAD